MFLDFDQKFMSQNHEEKQIYIHIYLDFLTKKNCISSIDIILQYFSYITKYKKYKVEGRSNL